MGSLKTFLSVVDTTAALITRDNIGNAASLVLPLKDTIHFELLRFALFIAGTDGHIEEDEVKAVRDFLGFSMDIQAINDYRNRQNLDAFISMLPTSLKYFVLADAGKKLADAPYPNQSAQVLTDTFRLFGEMMMGFQKSPSEDGVKRYTAYCTRMTDFLKEYGVFYTNNAKLLVPDFSCSALLDAPFLQTSQILQTESHVTEHGNILTQNETNDMVESLLEKLNSLTGLSQVKYEITSLVNLLRVQKMRAAKGLKNTSISNHLVFTGNPGTGKTTVARMLAGIYHGLGLLSRGQLIETDRSSLVCGYIGQTAIKVQEVIDSALGGILFIDEAYTLTAGKGENDFGQEAVDTLLKAMEDHRKDLIVIVAGYPDLMDEFLSSNPGLKSRFNKYIFFEDYTPEEQLQILEEMCTQQDYILSDEAKAAAETYFQKRQTEKAALIAAGNTKKANTYANARDVRNYLEQAIAKQAGRIINITVDKKTEAEQKILLSTIEAIDLP